MILRRDADPYPSIEGFADKLRALPPNLSEAKVLRCELCIYTDDSISIYFTPDADLNGARTGET